MSGSLLILAAHGCRHRGGVNERLKGLAQRVARESCFGEVAVAFYQGEPTFSRILDEYDAPDATVVPLMTSFGHFSRVVLPRELARNAKYRSMNVQCTRPVGTHPDMVKLVAGRVQTLLQANGLDPLDTALALVGHGTRRHADSCQATLDLADALKAMTACVDVVPAFLDQSPGVGTILERTRKPSVLVIPFLIADGPHTTQDIPARLGLKPPSGVVPPFRQRVGNRQIVYDRATGEEPGLVSLIIALAEEDS